MSNIFNDVEEDTEETLLQKLTKKDPETILKFRPLFNDKPKLYIPKILIPQLKDKFAGILGLELKDGDIVDKDSSKKDSYLLRIDDIIRLYHRRFSLTNEEQITDTITLPLAEKNEPYYRATFSIKKGKFGMLSLFSALINREASYGQQKLEGIVDARDLTNPYRFSQLVINETSRDRNRRNNAKGHFLADCNTSLSDHVSHHRWLFPNSPRLAFSALPIHFQNYLQTKESQEIPPFEWIENRCRNGSKPVPIGSLGQHPENVEDDSEIISMIMERPETRHYKESTTQTMERMKRMFVPRCIARGIDSEYAPMLQSRSLILPNKELEERCNNVVEIDIDRLRKILEAVYHGKTIDKVINPFTGDSPNFSILYYEEQSIHAEPRTYSIFQLYIHDGERFKSYLEVVNKKKPSNIFMLKADELERSNGRGKYAVEQFINGKSSEYHLELLPASHDAIICTPLETRDAVGKNGYLSAPRYKDIYNQIRS